MVGRRDHDMLGDLDPKRLTDIGEPLGRQHVGTARCRVTARMIVDEFWLYFLGALFIAVTLFLPNGLVGLVGQLRRKSKKEAAP